MTKPSTEELQETLKQLVTRHNEAVQVQNNCKEQIIAIQAVIQDRGDGDTNDSNSTDSEDWDGRNTFTYSWRTLLYSYGCSAQRP